jgi:putative transcriptional regulator
LVEAGYDDKIWQQAGANIKNHIRKYRGEKGLTETELGKKLGVSHRTISMLELSHYIDPRVSFAIRIARALGKRVEEIFEID